MLDAPSHIAGQPEPLHIMAISMSKPGAAKRRLELETSRSVQSLGPIVARFDLQPDSPDIPFIKRRIEKSVKRVSHKSLTPFIWITDQQRKLENSLFPVRR